jgi:hypothetical protein
VNFCDDFSVRGNAAAWIFNFRADGGNVQTQWPRDKFIANFHGRLDCRHGT